MIFFVFYVFWLVFKVVLIKLLVLIKDFYFEINKSFIIFIFDSKLRGDKKG